MGAFIEKRFLPRQDLDREQRVRISTLLRERLSEKREIIFAYIHGSFEEKFSFRDIDIALYLDRAAAFDFESDLSYELTQFVGYEVEVRIMNKAPVAFQMAVLQKGRVLVSRDEDKRAKFIYDVGKRYKEYAHFRNIFMEAIGGRTGR
ncbi:MAG: nucleotidyltransferase domain-containing protein [Deltaproteobacteria bacterium]|nr:MAG: nucleotidyltransferase domain-containing protein [Deltaproteobacteria bacterium]